LLLCQNAERDFIMGQEIEATFVEYGFDLVYRKLNSLVTSNNIPYVYTLSKLWSTF